MTLAAHLFSVADFREIFSELHSPSNKSTLSVAAAAGAFVWICYRILCRVRAKSLIRGLPGPNNPSWFAGTLT